MIRLKNNNLVLREPQKKVHLRQKKKPTVQEKSAALSPGRPERRRQTVNHTFSSIQHNGTS